ncbi:septum site-determining protein MinC [Fredinandcohnia sp. SECRCQ15]|uniref:Probable septum site-determining protein MinC n=1 Tax=Fredinandcohnia quinoae TaxID=2918902 RepID=A0AAW5EA62_9BACI|nr:septum site-determining protein MinC [Fredinandcohnia sp. SECRCQ15]
MKGQKQQFVTIKGTKDGLTLHLDDTCSFKELINDLEDKLSLNQKQNDDVPIVPVHVKIGNRYLTRKQDEEIRTIIRNKKHLVVDGIDSDVISKQEALEMKRKTEIVSVARMVRSGQVLKVEGDLMLIGDVNPGGTVIADGNIFILGSLRGIAHAGYNGRNDSVIAASIMKPTQLRISDIMNRAPDYTQSDGNEMECAYIDENETIVVDRLQQLTHLRPNLTRLEGGI